MKINIEIDKNDFWCLAENCDEESFRKYIIERTSNKVSGTISKKKALKEITPKLLS